MDQHVLVGVTGDSQVVRLESGVRSISGNFRGLMCIERVIIGELFCDVWKAFVDPGFNASYAFF